MSKEVISATTRLIKRANHRGFLTMAEVQQELEEAEATGEAFERVADELRNKGIKLMEEGPAITEEVVSVGEISVSDPVRLYLNDVGRYPLLTAQQEVELAMLIESGHRAAQRLEDEEELTGEDRSVLAHEMGAGQAAHSQLVQSNLRLVVSLARRYVGRGIPLLDLIQEGNVGLIKACERFDYRRGFKFSTYATWWIRQALARAVADQGRTIRMPIHVIDAVNKVTRAKVELTQVLTRSPTMEELAEELEMDVERVVELTRMAMETVSLETPIGEDQDGTLGDLVEDVDSERPADVASFLSLQDELAEALDNLNPREREVLVLRFGLADGKMRTLDEVGEHFNVTRERVRQLETKALAKLRHPDKAGKLQGFLDSI